MDREPLTARAVRDEVFGTPTDLTPGTRRPRAAALLSLALPGADYRRTGAGGGDRVIRAVGLRQDRGGTRAAAQWAYGRSECPRRRASGRGPHLSTRP
ncbi:hypothetical protein C5746_03730 [Streptomyces atratus]|uniref:Uncharacterized protein n=1 Tax=Streptomyces atratus TaxID=1893 RepID=A0A2Z5J7A3_STRAR|nr:hypothetical protein C5746_03730 [Streptomyces atratus]